MYRVTILSKLLTSTCLCYQAVQVGTGQRVVMLCGWEDNHRSGDSNGNLSRSLRLVTCRLSAENWDRLRTRVHFKLAVLAYKALHDQLPSYLAEDCQLVGRRRLRSSHIDTCQVRRTNTRFGEHSFAAAGPRTLNSLPIQLRDSELSLGQFRRSLKHIFSSIYSVTDNCSAEWLCFSCAWHELSYLLTYLLTFTSALSECSFRVRLKCSQ